MKIFTNIRETITSNCVVTVGIFDGVHLGHQYLLKQLQNIANSENTEELIITMNPHPSIFFGKDMKLLNTLNEKIEHFQEKRIRNLLILDFNKELVNTSQLKFLEDILVKKLKAKSLILGYDNAFGLKETRNQQQSYTLPTIKIGEYKNGSKIKSSEIRNILKTGKVEEASKLLGYNYIISGTVEKGEQIGHKLGFPTANLGNIDEHKLIPAKGVYVIEVKYNEKWLPAMLNIGTRPTFNATKETIELHILDFNENIYSKQLKIKFLKRIRNEQKFDNINSLIIQLNKDKQTTENYFCKTNT